MVLLRHKNKKKPQRPQFVRDRATRANARPDCFIAIEVVRITS
jgi:hypothetical protein